MTLYYIEFDIYTRQHWTRLRITYHTKTTYLESLATVLSAPHVRELHFGKEYVR